MGSKRWHHTGTIALAGILAGLVITLVKADSVVIAVVLFCAGAAFLPLSLVKKWLTDTTYERERLRHATLLAEDEGRQAQVGRALQFAERERDRGFAAAGRLEADRRVAAAEAQMEQNSINTAMRAHAFEESCEARYKEKLAEGIAAERQRADEEIATAKLELSNERTQLMISQFMGGVYAERNGEVDAILAAMEDPKLIHLDDHRRQDPPSRAADGR